MSRNQGELFYFLLYHYKRWVYVSFRQYWNLNIPLVLLFRYRLTSFFAFLPTLNFGLPIKLTEKRRQKYHLHISCLSGLGFVHYLQFQSYEHRYTAAESVFQVSGTMDSCYIVARLYRFPFSYVYIFARASTRHAAHEGTTREQRVRIRYDTCWLSVKRVASFSQEFSSAGPFATIQRDTIPFRLNIKSYV